MEISEIQALGRRIRENIAKVIIGKEGVIDLVVTALLGGGHVLLEDVPGTGKTVLAKSLARSVGVDFKRVQFTPDLLPSDLTGINYYNQKQGDFTFRRGPVFTGILLADEINRATPRTQSSLLECMEERQVTVDGTTYPLAEPYFVIATQNPVETQGTFPLPEAQLDRFLIKTSVGYPGTDQAAGLLRRFIDASPLETLRPVCTREEILDARTGIRAVHVSDDIMRYIVAIVEKTRVHHSVRMGVSPRGSLALLRASQVYAALRGKAFVSPDIVKSLAVPVLGHRLILREDYRTDRPAPADVIGAILGEIPAPAEDWELG